MDNRKKNTSKVLTTDDIRKRARDWTLAGDVGLLAHLEQFSENIINKTNDTQKNFHALVDDYEELYTKVGNVTNQFLALQNCQFIENRVYDEETPTEEKAEVKVQDEAEQEKLLLAQYKEAVEVGIGLLDTHFQEVELPLSSDSDEDDEISAGNSVIWKPKNPYANKKFPSLIGSVEWWADDQAGLRTNEISDTDKIMSESESDVESLKSIEKTMKLSSSTSMENIIPVSSKPILSPSSSEDLFIVDKSENQNSNASDVFSKDSGSVLEEPPNFHSDFEREPEKESKQRKDSFNEDQLQDKEASQDKTATGQPKKIENDFTKELMAKLASVTNKNEKLGKENSPPTEVETENLFDETDVSSDLFSTKINKISEKLVKNKNLLFDGENGDELFKNEKDLFSENNLFEDRVSKKPESQPFKQNNLETPKERESFEKKKTIAPKKSSVDLFDDLADDDALFTVKSQTHKLSDRSSEAMENSKTILSSGFGWDNDEGLFDSINTEIDNDFFNSSGFVDFKREIVAESKRDEDKMSNLLSKEPNIDRRTGDGIETTGSEISIPEADVSKMTSAKDAFDDSLGFSISKESRDMKISFLESKDEDDLFSGSFKEEPKPDEDAAAALFTEKPKPADSVSVSSSRSSLFEDLSASKSRLLSVFEKNKNSKLDDDLFNIADDDKPGKDFSSSKGKPLLFDDCDDGDDLFGETKHDSAKKNSEIWVNATKEKIFKESQQQAKSFIADLGDDDLFKTSETLTKLRESKIEVETTQSEKKLFINDFDDYDLFCDRAETVKPKPPSTLSLGARETGFKERTVGKLNIPSDLKVKFESAAKHISPDGVGSPAEEQEEGILNVDLKSSVLLKCPSKDRVKIPGRRRPQSRRARQEAIRNSETSWDRPTSPCSGPGVTRPSKDSSSPLASYPLSPSTDEEDFFKVPELDKNFEKEDQSIFKSDLFESAENSKLEDNLLFDGAPLLSPLSPETSEVRPEVPKTDSLFGFVKSKTPNVFHGEQLDDDDDDDDENLFKISDSSKGGSALFHSTTKEEEEDEGKVKKLLFEFDVDDDEEDDLFKGKSFKTPSEFSAVDKIKEGGEAKDNRSSSFVDPLGLITKESEYNS